eukprot:3463285-Pyramimonas_sp.AAC.1
MDTSMFQPPAISPGPDIPDSILPAAASISAFRPAGPIDYFRYTLGMDIGGHPLMSTITCCSRCAQISWPPGGCRSPRSSRTKTATPPEGIEPLVALAGMAEHVQRLPAAHEYNASRASS